MFFNNEKVMNAKHNLLNLNNDAFIQRKLKKIAIVLVQFSFLHVFTFGR
jgi:hypothetical protein